MKHEARGSGTASKIPRKYTGEGLHRSFGAGRPTVESKGAGIRSPLRGGPQRKDT